MSSPCWPLGSVCGECFLLASLRRTTLCILLLTGLCLCLHKYHFVNNSKTFQEAQVFCKTYFTDLATVDNMVDMQQLVAAFDSGYEGSAWIGLYDIDWAWDWSLLDLRYYKPGEYLYRVWSAGEPNQPRTQTLCVGILGGYWFDFFCTETFTFVCYINPNDPTLEATSTANYIYINQTMVWADAQTYCKQHYKELASVRNATENMLIMEVVPNDLMVWIGLYKISWIWWSDSSVSRFTYWISGRPLATSGNCVSSVKNATVSGQWMENPCTNNLNMMCYSSNSSEALSRHE
ncbi:macrophage mannose receptor 1-like isoform X2 [Betta splendens]|uniref:Macrophage mannose receptor 1-like isoform X2 n=1 Tax=Betta splendens TaxID=158456 RepID=A0A9W2XMX7_BETSP|nr:macrophage mannose receptor 1-like isoform X2 [Betta splendens]